MSKQDFKVENIVEKTCRFNNILVAKGNIGFSYLNFSTADTGSESLIILAKGMYPLIYPMTNLE